MGGARSRHSEKSVMTKAEVKQGIAGPPQEGMSVTGGTGSLLLPPLGCHPAAPAAAHGCLVPESPAAPHRVGPYGAALQAQRPACTGQGGVCRIWASHKQHVNTGFRAYAVIKICYVSSGTKWDQF